MKRSYSFISLAGAATVFLAVAFLTQHNPTQAAVDITNSRKLVQPDYEAYQKVHGGMDESEVLKLLGEPIAKPDPFDRNTDVGYHWVYGSIAAESLVFPKPPIFQVWFQRGKVYTREDPFQDHFSKDGTPTPPRPLWPDQPPTYHFYPRYVDFRWSASSGQYPMHYEIQVGAFKGGDLANDANWTTDKLKSDIPFLAHSFVGDQPGRWRVRALNRKGTSEWSDYCNFVFDNGAASTHLGKSQ